MAVDKRWKLKVSNKRASYLYVYVFETILVDVKTMQISKR